MKDPTSGDGVFVNALQNPPAKTDVLSDQQCDSTSTGHGLISPTLHSGTFRRKEQPGRPMSCGANGSAAMLSPPLSVSRRMMSSAESPGFTKSLDESILARARWGQVRYQGDRAYGVNDYRDRRRSLSPTMSEDISLDSPQTKDGAMQQGK
jgi:hypothetical protein